MAPRWSPGWASSRTSYGIGREHPRRRDRPRHQGADRVRGGRRAASSSPRHRELEKLVLTKWQTFWKDQLGRFYGDRLHEGQYFDPALRDIEALITSSQAPGHRRDPCAPRAGPVPGGRHPEPALDDGHLHRDVRRGEPALDRGRGPRFRSGLGGAVIARCAGAGDAERRPRARFTTKAPEPRRTRRSETESTTFLCWCRVGSVSSVAP